jgi:cysteinyl-tRNA synthetase
MKDVMGVLRVFNTLTRTKDVFEAKPDRQVNVFVCGPTVYDYPHLGHAKTATQFDFIVRYLRLKGYDVYYLQNITDIDDKIIRRARERGISWQQLSREYERIYLEDMLALGNTAVTTYARATDYISQIVTQVNTLLAKGYAYRTRDGVYYDLTKFPGYGKLSRRTELRTEDAVTTIDECSEKKNVGDFCLWKARKPNEPYWDTSLGAGRPGWHIEDTAITESFFGPQYDVHGGAVDLIFPHHEAEIAQMEAASGIEPLVRYWLHTGFLRIDSQKMSKSLGNFTSIRETLKHHKARVLRFFFVTSHYRSAIDLTDSSLTGAQSALNRIEEFVFGINVEYNDLDDEPAVDSCRKLIFNALDDDFNTPRAFAALFDFIRSQNTKGKSGMRTYALFQELNEIFGIMDVSSPSLKSEVDRLIAERQGHRARRDFSKADEIRVRLHAMGIHLYDTREGVKWRQISI